MAYASTDQYDSGTRISQEGDGKSRALHGMKAICAYMGKSENTILKYIRDEGLPAAKIGGEWVSDEGRIDGWRLERIG